MASIVHLRPTAAPTPAPSRAATPSGRLLGRVERWLRRAHTRRELRALNDRQLRDIGLTRAEVADPLE